MGLFSKIFGSTSNSSEPSTSKVQWIPLTDVQQLDTIVEESNTQSVAIFKHSTRCGISNMVIKQFQNSYNLEADAMKMYYLDLLNYRSISDEIAARFQVWHESPQLIILRNEKIIAHASHGQINAIALHELV